MSSFMGNGKQIALKVHQFKQGVHKFWETKAYIASEDDEEVKVECFLEDQDEQLIPVPTTSYYVPQSPPLPPSPPPAGFRAIVHDTQLWASPEEDEEEVEEVEEEVVQPVKKRGRPKGSKNRPKGDDNQPKKKGKCCSAAIMMENISSNLECIVCTEDSQLLVKCSKPVCDAFLCIECLKKLEELEIVKRRKREAMCPYCRLKF